MCAKENNYPTVSEVLLVGHSEIKRRDNHKETLSKESECETVRRSFDVYSVAANPLSLCRDVTARDGST